jgi:O-antigen/teichoic acid export membrane protein
MSRNWFSARMSGERVKQASVRGVAASALRRACTYAIKLGSMIFLARLLTPSDHGLIAMVMVFIGITGILVDLQMSGVTIRFHQLTHAQASNLFWVRIANACVITIVIVVSAPLIRLFYDDPRVQAITTVMALSVLLSALGAQHRALLSRALDIETLARAEIWSAVLTAVVSIWGAYRGMAYWSLVAGILAGNIASVILLWRFCDWRPSGPSRGTGVRLMMTFGLRLTTYAILSFISRNIGNLIIGRNLGSGIAGQYYRATSVHGFMMDSVLAPLDSVAGSAMAKLIDDPMRMSNYYYKTCTIAVIGVIPITFVGLVQPHELIHVLLGSQWAQSADILRWLSVGALPAVICHSTGWVYAAIGDAKALMRWGFIGWPIMILGTLLGARFGAEGVAIAVSMALFILMIPCMLAAFSATPLKLLSLFKSLVKPLLAGITAGLLSCALLVWLRVDVPSVRLAMGTGAFMLLYATLLVTVFGQRQLVLDIVAHIRAGARRSLPA